MAEATLSIQIIPVVPEEQIYPLVDQAIAMISASGFTYWIGPSETTIEGDLTSMLELVQKLLRSTYGAGASRIISHIKIDYKPSGVTIDEKIHKYLK